MPLTPAVRQPEAALHWFAGMVGQTLLESESLILAEALEARFGMPWLCLSTQPRPLALDLPPHGLWLRPGTAAWHGEARVGLPLPLATESVGAVVIQHAGDLDGLAPPIDVLLEEAVRVLVPGGRVTLFALNPLSPWRRHWLGTGLKSREPITWRKRLQAAGLVVEGVAQGIGPRWGLEPDFRAQRGASSRAGYVLVGEKRRIPMTARRVSVTSRVLGEGV